MFCKRHGIPLTQAQIKTLASRFIGKHLNLIFNLIPIFQLGIFFKYNEESAAAEAKKNKRPPPPIRKHKEILEGSLLDPDLLNNYDLMEEAKVNLLAEILRVLL
jgi:hypothetical protein